MDIYDFNLAFCLSTLGLLLILDQLTRPNPPEVRRRAVRRVWTREWLLRRELYGDFENLLAELHREDAQGFKSFIRITPELFQEMVEKITPIVKKETTKLRKPLPVGLKLAVTLRFLATGNSYSSLQFSFRTSKSAISRFVPVVCQALIDCYKQDTLQCPTTPEGWKEVAAAFSRKWNYNNCLGALDGKHVAMKKPAGAGSVYFNYKKFHSIILMALADAHYRFLYVDIGAEGGAGDAGTWVRCSLHQAIENGRIGFPAAETMPNDDQPIPYHIVADDAFALKTWLMKPFSHLTQVHHERVFSYRLSRARRVVENAFGILQMRWRVFSTTMLLRPRVVRVVTLCACVLHNLLMTHQPVPHHHLDHEDINGEVIQGTWREQPNLMENLLAEQARNPTREAKALRNYMGRYYASAAGSVPWQERLLYPRGRPDHVGGD